MFPQDCSVSASFNSATSPPPPPPPPFGPDVALISAFLSQYPQLHTAFLRSLEIAALPDLSIASPGCSMASISNIEDPNLKQESPLELFFSDMEQMQSPAPSEDSYAEELFPKRRMTAVQHNQHRCANCNTTVASRWRRDDEGQRVCNACGVYFRLYGRKRVVAKTAKIVKRRNRVAKESSLCDSE
ncbi:hypothetical protein CcCBS67573_g06207 [Chytriomyces confervae]|uniref:GATA-type domain-containing protein n=1 Tax=Chytriomyces confervae TaxID=246404 RepID=A0A507F7G0_9FUNG|nr:hypothetical protein CcCBS67573_g06207 [Chytriomyces confervae]